LQTGQESSPKIVLHFSQAFTSQQFFFTLFLPHKFFLK